MKSDLKAVCFGEILFDVFPDEEQIGGAPLNVASRLSHLGIQTEMISQLGNDERGEKLLKYLQNNSIDTSNVLISEKFATGIVQVSLSASGSASYEIKHPAAWDKIVVNEGMKNAVKNCDAFVFGSLASRDEVSRNTLFELLNYATYKILDFNLRPPHYNKELIIALIQKADFIKFNDDELFEIAAIIGSPFNSLEQNLQFINDQTQAKAICVTKGRHGAVIMMNKNLYYNSGFNIQVVDTVGAGDSFLARLIAGILKNEEPQNNLNTACAVGALVAGSSGANPVFTQKEITNFMFPQYKNSSE